MKNNLLDKLINKTIDCHVHIGNDSHLDGTIKRMYSLQELAKVSSPKIFVAKAHFIPIIPERENVYGSTTLNWGFNTEQVIRASREMTKPFLVWGPTLNAQAHHQAVSGDTAWKSLFGNVTLGKPISILSTKGELQPEVDETLHAIKETGAIFATGHLAQSEVIKVVQRAIDIGVRNVVLSHVGSRHNRLPIKTQIKLIKYGRTHEIPVFAEHCAITWFDGLAGAYDLVRDFVQPILTIGSKNCIISSDCGRYVSTPTDKPVSPTECLERFGQLLLENGLTLSDLEIMMIKNPKQLLDIHD